MVVCIVVAWVLLKKPAVQISENLRQVICHGEQQPGSHSVARRFGHSQVKLGVEDCGSDGFTRAAHFFDHGTDAIKLFLACTSGSQGGHFGLEQSAHFGKLNQGLVAKGGVQDADVGNQPGLHRASHGHPLAALELDDSKSDEALDRFTGGVLADSQLPGKGSLRGKLVSRFQAFVDDKRQQRLGCGFHDPLPG